MYQLHETIAVAAQFLKAQKGFAPFDAPRGFGVKNPQEEDDTHNHEQQFSKGAPDAWSNKDDSGIKTATT